MSQVNYELTEKKCVGKAIYSELNYEKLRKQRLNQVDGYYKKVLNKYEENKRKYNQQFATTAKQADKLTEELNTKLGPNATPDQKQEGEQSIKPDVIRLNQQLLNIAQNVLKDNTETSKGLAQQYADLAEQEKKLDNIISEVDNLKAELDKQKQKQLARKTMIDNSSEASKSSYYWYIGLTVINVLLLLVIVIYIIIIMNSSGSSGSSGSSISYLNSRRANNTSYNNRTNRPNSR